MFYNFEIVCILYNHIYYRGVEYMTTDDEVTRYHREGDIPVPLQKKLELLRHFTEYMDDFLTEGKFNFFYFIQFVCYFFYS